MSRNPENRKKRMNVQMSRRWIRTAATGALSFGLLVLPFGAISIGSTSFRTMTATDAFAATTDTTSSPEAIQITLDQPVTYTVRIFTGEQGTIEGAANSGHTKVISNIDPTDSSANRVTFYAGDITLTDSKYYVKGIRESGTDSGAAVDNASFKVTKDVDYVVAYGLKGDGAVAYTVSYVDENGNQLRDSETFYGQAGEQTIVGYRYIEGYQPTAYNLSRTLSEDEGKNTFPFVYRSTASTQSTTTTGGTTGAAGTTGTPGTTGGTTGMTGTNGTTGTTGETTGTTGGTNGTGGGTNAGGATGTTDQGTADTSTEEPQEMVNLDDPETPLAQPDTADAATEAGDDIEATAETTGLGTSAKTAIVAIIAAAVAAIAGGTVAAKRKKRDEEEL